VQNTFSLSCYLFFRPGGPPARRAAPFYFWRTTIIANYFPNGRGVMRSLIFSAALSITTAVHAITRPF